MTAPSACPDRPALEDFGLGRIDDQALATIGAHVETCVECRRIVANLAADSFVGRLREAHDRPADAEESLATDREETPSDEVSDRAAHLVDAPPELLDHPDYELIRELGRGGMGVVYLARNRPLDRLEVLKVVGKKLLDVPGALERFQREIRSAAKLNHPNIVGAYTVLRPGDLLVFAMEYVDGSDLAQTVKRRGPLPVTNAAFYAHQAALGLQHAHEQRMVHRDIKPNNLMLAISGKKHVVKILDFGLAKATSEDQIDGSLTKSGQMLGTPDYVAPEQTLDAQAADIRADIYSLGCTLYFLLAGRAPFGGNSLYEILRAHHAEQATPLDRLRADVPPALAAGVAKMMAKQPADRYQTPAEAARALDPFFRVDKSKRASGANMAVSGPAAADGANVPGVPSPGLPGAGALPVARALDLSPGIPVAAAVRPASYGESMAFSIVAPSGPATLKGRTSKNRGSSPPHRRVGMLTAAAAGAAALFGIWVYVRDKDGNETARIQVPDGGSVVVQPAAGPKASPAPTSPAAVEPPQIVFLSLPNVRPPAVPSPTSTATIATIAPPQPAAPRSAPPPAVSPTMSAPADAVSFGTKRYKVFTERVTWSEASARCARMGGLLAEVHAQVKNDFLVELAKSAGLPSVWLGLTDERSEGQWAWTGGSAVTYTAWDLAGGRQPNNAWGVEDYAVLAADNGKWWDYPHDPSKYPALAGHGLPGFICQWDAANEPTIAPPGPTTSAPPVAPATAPLPAVAPFDAAQARAHQEAWAKHLATTVEMTNSIGMKMVLIPPGEFRMGSTDEQVDVLLSRIARKWFGNDLLRFRKIREAEVPQHNVRLTKPILMGMTEVTLGQFKQFCATGYVTEAEIAARTGKGVSKQARNDPKRTYLTYLAPDYPISDDLPVSVITWNDAVKFCEWLSTREGVTYRLPTEAEWEFACRAGTTSLYHYGDDAEQIDLYCWHSGNSRAQPHPVGTKLPNGFGLFDMHGNLEEWCADRYDSTWYQRSPAIDPLGPTDVAMSSRVSRGAYFASDAVFHTSAERNSYVPSHIYPRNGFRCVCELSESKTATMKSSSATLANPAKKGSASNTPDAAGIARLQRVLLAHSWTYRDSLFRPDAADHPGHRYYDDGTFHHWRWKYWVVGPREIRVHYDQAQTTPETGVLLTFNDDLTEYLGEFTSGRGRHVISGKRKSVVSGSTK